MRIAIIAAPWLPVPPPAYGGTEAVLDELCRELVSSGHDVLLCTTGDSTCPVERSWSFATSLGVATMSPAAELRHVITAYDAIRAWGADIVHDHSMTGPFVADLPGVPVITTNHGPFDDDLAPVYRRMARLVPIIAISHHQARTARDVPIAAVIHHGINPRRFPIGSGRGGYALFLGRMTPDKGVHTAIRVAREAGMPLKIAAKMREPGERAYFDERIRPLLGRNVEYLGEVGGADKLALLGDAVCLLNPIAWPEPFGMVMIESLACGTPVVSTPLGAAPEIVDDGVTGFLRRDDHSLVTAVGHIDSIDRADCRRSAETRFSARRMADDHLLAYAALPAFVKPDGDMTRLAFTDVARPPVGAT